MDEKDLRNYRIDEGTAPSRSNFPLTSEKYHRSGIKRSRSRLLPWKTCSQFSVMRGEIGSRMRTGYSQHRYREWVSRRKNYTLNASEATRTWYLSARSNKYTNRGINSIPHFVPFNNNRLHPIPATKTYYSRWKTWFLAIHHFESITKKKKKKIDHQVKRDNFLSSRSARESFLFIQGLMLIRAIERYPVRYPFQFKLERDAINSLESSAFNLFATSIKLSF